MRARLRHEELPPLAGVPFGVKDLEHCAGMPTTFGSRWFLDAPPVAHDEIHVERLRAAGAIPIGKTATPEFGNWAYTASPALGVTRNPWNLERTPGGSSGGSAAAVSAGMVPFATASDGGGSIRGPASMTGLVGLKPNYGRIPTYGVTHLAQNAVAGSLTTNVRDHALLLDVMAGPDGRDRTCLPPSGIRYVDVIEALDVAGLRAAWTRDLGFAVVDPECVEIVRPVGGCLDRVGGTRRGPPADRIRRLHPDVFTHRGRRQVRRHRPVVVDGARRRTRPRSRGGWGSTAAATLPKLARVEDARRRLEQETAALFDDVDVLLLPTCTLPPFAAEGPMPTEVDGRQVHAGMASVLQMFANLMNLPAISVPAGVDRGWSPGRLADRRTAIPRGHLSSTRTPRRRRHGPGRGMHPPGGEQLRSANVASVTLVGMGEPTAPADFYTGLVAEMYRHLRSESFDPEPYVRLVERLRRTGPGTRVWRRRSDARSARARSRRRGSRLVSRHARTLPPRRRRAWTRCHPAPFDVRGDGSRTSVPIDLLRRSHVQPAPRRR